MVILYGRVDGSLWNSMHLADDQLQTFLLLFCIGNPHKRQGESIETINTLAWVAASRRWDPARANHFHIGILQPTQLDAFKQDFPNPIPVVGKTHVKLLHA